NVVQILEARLAIEREAAYLAATRRTEDDLLKMKQLIDVCHNALKGRKLNEFLVADIELHQTIVEASQNNVLIDLYASLTDSLQFSIEQIASQHEIESNEHSIHRELYQAIKEENPKMAGELVKKYITAWKKFVEKSVEE